MELPEMNFNDFVVYEKTMGKKYSVRVSGPWSKFAHVIFFSSLSFVLEKLHSRDWVDMLLRCFRVFLKSRFYCNSDSFFSLALSLFFCYFCCVFIWFMHLKWFIYLPSVWCCCYCWMWLYACWFFALIFSLYRLFFFPRTVHEIPSYKHSIVWLWLHAIRFTFLSNSDACLILSQGYVC